QAGALIKGGVQQQAGDQARLDADVGVGVVRRRTRGGLTPRPARLVGQAAPARSRALALGGSAAHTDTWVPSSTTRPGGMRKKSVGLAAFRIRKINSLSCHMGMPWRADGTTERRPRKKLVDMISNFSPCLRHRPSARGTFGVSI